MSVRVESGGRLHFGFLNLSLARERLYGSLGVGLDEPRVAVEASRAEGVHCDHERAREYAARACDLLGVPGVDLRVESELPVHTGLGSGTQLSLSVLAAVARAYDEEPRVRERAPRLGRGGRSGVGVATFESGGFVFDAGHPTERFTAERPPRGEWAVPPVAARHDVPEDWRFVLVLPDTEPGKADGEEDASMRSTVESADPALADRISGVVTRRVLPALATGDVDAFGAAVAEVGRLNGAWYADEQGGVYRPPAGALVDELGSNPAVAGAGQSSWGPAVYGVTDASRADAAAEAGWLALDEAGVGGDVRVVEARNEGARTE
ncbi:beta-ribofuranosylaminobenzene 5'-phosphate synthase family protein [Halobacterium litoreum]|uniref:Beta-ribofuranosylaminobenzene 5'-phosphate synthase n=1 Tax=Halobacterium litoreum TaxID=2039234 RepID=A0ABD5NE83_9EURY|nr:beta-ribofuranosylaminobenzene 5'-phosphate synthase family protein [Halobacterium litoreum]UHH13936.1 GHMP kinase [Halobacterium litoreum]